MAPTGPRNGSGASRGKNNATTTNGTKGSSRGGGISKRRGANNTKVDRDGDLDMGAVVAKPAAKTGSAPTKPRRSAPQPASSGSRPSKPRAAAQASQIIQKVIRGGTGNTLASRLASGMEAGDQKKPKSATAATVLKIAGLKDSKAAANEGGGLKELLTFLERKAQSVGKLTRNVRIRKSQLRSDIVYVTVSKEDAEEILKLNNFAFAGTTLAIAEAPEGMPTGSALSSEASDIKEALRNVLSLRYDVNSKLLTLANLGEDATLNQLGIFSGEANPEKMFRALMAICDGIFKSAKDKREGVTSISLAGNNIDEVTQVMSLADTFPDVAHIDFSRNQIRDLKGLQKWRNRLRNLQTLLLNDNPIEANEPHYPAELMTWFPKLQVLSGNQIRTPEQVAAEEAASRPTPIPQFGADFRDINRIGEQFVTEFLQGYDNNRAELAAKYYEDESTFSFAVNNRSPHAPDIQPPAWTAYLKASRNHTKINHLNARMQRLFRGTAQIQQVWQQLPATRHPDLQSQLDKYIIDCHPVNGLADPTGQNPVGVDGMIITMHGEFEDQEPTTMNLARRSFSRTFILGPGSRTPIRVVSDMLSLKVFNPVPSAAPASQTAPQSAPVPNQEDQRQQMLLELCKQTGMTPEYSKFCLDGANWNFEQALVSFNEKRADLPKEAFAMAPNA